MGERQTNEQVIETIKHLLNKTVEKGATAQEAASAAAMAQRLADKHNLSMLEIERHKLKEHGFEVQKETFKSIYKKMPPWAKYLSSSLAEAFDCQLVTGERYDGTILYFIGMPVDCAVVRYLYVHLENELYYDAQRKAKSLGYEGKYIKYYRDSFIIAAAEEIQRRVREMRNEDKGASPKLGQLIVLKGQLVEQAKNAMFPKLKKGRSYSIRDNGLGTRDGQEAGRRADLMTNKIHGTTGEAQRRLQ